MAKGHSCYSASGSGIWLRCAGALALRMFGELHGTIDPEGQPGEAASWGTVAHALAERCLIEERFAEEFIGEVHQADGRDILVTAEMAEVVEVYVGTIMVMMQQAGDNAKLYLEHHGDLSNIAGGDVGGTTDCAIVHEKKLSVLDFKTGFIVVEPKDNSQAYIYSAQLIWGRNPLPGADDIEEIEVVIVQPRAIHREGTTRRHKLTRLELERWLVEVLIPGRKACAEEDPPLNPGAWCKYCPASNICPSKHEQAIRAINMIQNKPLNELTDTEIAELWAMAPMVNQLFKEVGALAHKRLDMGEKIPGLKLVRGNTHRVWKKNAEEFIRANVGKAAFETKLKTPAAIEKLGPAGKQAAAKYGFKPEGTLKVALEEDASPPVPGSREGNPFE